MLSRSLVLAALAVAFMAVGTSDVSAQGMVEPGYNSSHQYIDAESQAVDSAPLTAWRPSLRLMGLSLLWSHSLLPASPLRVPSMSAALVPGDRRWGLR